MFYFSDIALKVFDIALASFFKADRSVAKALGLGLTVVEKLVIKTIRLLFENIVIKSIVIDMLKTSLGLISSSAVNHICGSLLSS